MKLQFTKYHGTGNDFIMVDSRINDISDRSVDTISKLCDRHFGIGADGLIVLDESEQHDFRMSYYNADGRPGTMCGNGGRSATAFAHAQGWISGNCIFEAADGLHTGSILPDGRIKLSLNDVAGVESLLLPVTDHPALAGAGDAGSDAGVQAYFLNTGSPHLVLFSDDVDQLDVYTVGRKLRYDARFPDGTNVNFVLLTAEGIRVRTYERGVENETLSCGTGVTASAIAASLHWPQITPPVKVNTLGGNLEVSFKASTDSASGSTIGTIPTGGQTSDSTISATQASGLTLTGPATRVFEGTIDI